MTEFMRMKYENPKLNQSEIANQLGYSSTLQRYRNDISMRSHRTEFNQITPINEQKKLSNTNLHKNSHRDHDLKRPR